MTKPAPSPSPRLPVSLAANPVLSSWVRFSSEGHVTVSPGKVEIGQGIVTALAQIAADELDVDIGRIRMVRASTTGSPGLHPQRSHAPQATQSALVTGRSTSAQ